MGVLSQLKRLLAVGLLGSIMSCADGGCGATGPAGLEAQGSTGTGSTLRLHNVDEGLLRAEIERLGPLHRALPKPRPGEWLQLHHEPGQSFDDYLVSAPPALTSTRLVVQPLGPLSPGQRRVVEASSEYLRGLLGVRVEQLASLSLTQPPDARESWSASGYPVPSRRLDGVVQWSSQHLLQRALRRPQDAFGVVAPTARDLWPGDGYNFVFGQADPGRGVAVWSMHRHGDADSDERTFRLALLRTLKTAAHETAHLLGLEHCTAYACVMNGANSLSESDEQPLHFCPECAAKLSWVTRVPSSSRYLRLSELCARWGLAREAAFFQRSFAALQR